jgi:hypothetical protein
LVLIEWATPLTKHEQNAEKLLLQGAHFGGDRFEHATSFLLRVAQT